MHDFEHRLLSFINSEVNLDPNQQVAGSTDLLLTGLVDSLGVIEIVGWIQDEADAEIDARDIVFENFQTVDRMVALVERLNPALVTG